MSVCSSCGQEFIGKQKICKPCRERLIRDTWKRQMRTYMMMMALGLGMLVYAYFQFTGQHYQLSEAPPLLLATTILGGLGLMGGLFGLGLAVFFSIWHGRAHH